MIKKTTYLLEIILPVFLFSMCQKNSTTSTTNHRVFSTSFESVNDFNGFYIVPQNYMNTSSHELSTEKVHSGTYSHKAWVYGTNPESTPNQNNNHRAYPTVQFQKTVEGVLHTPCYITLWVFVDMNLVAHTPENQWLSFATFSTDTSNTWKRTICVNLSYDGFVHLMHVPLQGQKEWLFQTNSVKFTQNKWVKLKVYLDTRPQTGYAKVWQNDTLVSYARISDGNGTLAQAHFGLYAAPSVSSGVIYNDDLEIREVDNEQK